MCPLGEIRNVPAFSNKQDQRSMGQISEKVEKVE